MLLTIDTLRSDALGCYGADGDPTPAIDRIAAAGRLFERAYGPATITHPSLSSVLTGLLPVRHGVGDQAQRLRPGVVPLAVQLQAAGIPTASFVANLCKLQEQPNTVFHDGWDETFCGMDDTREQGEWDEAVVSAAIEWMEAQDGPFFAWIHLMDPHAEHRPPPELWDYAARPVEDKAEQYRSFGHYEEQRTFPPDDRMRELWDLYAAEVRGVDRQVGRVDAYLGGRDDADELALIISADHGEELFETWSRYDHGLSMTEGVLWVPLILRAPGVEPNRVAPPVEIGAIAGTVLELFGLRPPYDLDSPSLFAAPERDFALSFVGQISVSLRTRDHRFWFRRSEEPYTRAPDEFPWRADAKWFLERECLADYEPSDPTAVRWLNLADPAHAAVAGVLRAEMKAVAKAFEDAGGAVIDDPELAEQLRALGYVPD